MSNIYVPPDNTDMPFNFTERGYSVPNNRDIGFNFQPLGSAGNLQAAINVVQPYWYETHSYPKSCPKYVIGYGPGGIQIIKGRCTYGGIRDLRGFITAVERGFVSGDLPTSINPILDKGQSDIKSELFAIQPSDLAAIIGIHVSEDITAEIEATRPTGTKDLDVLIDTHSPGDLSSYIATHQTIDLPVLLEGIKRKGNNNLGGIIDIHQSIDLSSVIGTHTPERLRTSIKSVASGYSDINSSLTIWSAHDLGSNIGTHSSGNLEAHIGGSGKGTISLPSVMIGERFKGSGNLVGYINAHLPGNLSSSITGSKSGITNLPSSIWSWEEGFLSANVTMDIPRNIGASIIGKKSDVLDLASTIMPWHIKQLSANISVHSPKELSSILRVHLPKKLFAILKPWHRIIEGNLSSSVKGWQSYDLHARMRGIWAPNLGVVVKGWAKEVPYDLPTNLYGWQESPDLASTIKTHSPINIAVSIRSWHKETYRDIPASLHGWQENSLSSYIDSHLYKGISASFRPWYVGVYNNLSARVAVYQSDDLSAATGGHMWGILTGRVLPHPPPPIRASIRVWHRGVQGNLPASIYGWQEDNLAASIEAHIYRNLRGILKGVVLGASKDMPTSIYGWQDSNLTSNISAHSPRNLEALLKGQALEVVRSLPSSIWGWQEGNLGTITKGGHLPSDMMAHIRIFQYETRELPANIYGWQDDNLGATIGTSKPVILKAFLRPWHRKLFRNLTGSIYGWAISDLPAYVRTHGPKNLAAAITASAAVYQNIPAGIYGWAVRFLGMTLAGTHAPADLSAHLQAKQRNLLDLSAYIRAWHTGNLSGSISAIFSSNLSSYLQVVTPESLSAYLKVRPQGILTANVYGWGSYYLGAYIKRIHDKYLSAFVNPISDISSTLRARLKGVGSSYGDLKGWVRNMHTFNLPASLRAVYLADLDVYIFAIPPKDLGARIHVWQERFLQAALNGQDYPWNLKASLTSTGGFRSLDAILVSKAATGIYGTMTANCHGMVESFMPSRITGILTGILHASLTASGNARNLLASISPKMIRLTTVVSIATQNSNNLSAIINCSCFRTASTNLKSYLKTVFKSDLPSFVRPLRFNYKPSLLNAKVGYSDSILEVDKLKLSINISPSEVISEDIMRLRFEIFKAGITIGASITGIMTEKHLPTYIKGMPADTYTYSTPLRNREVVLHTSHSGVFKQFEYVEMSFRSMVKDYYYNSDASVAWKKDRFDRWALDVKSFFPANSVLGLKRRLHRETILYDLKAFESVDEAIRFAISYVIDSPRSNLGATIYNRGTYRQLQGTINPRVAHSDRTGLPSVITGIDNKIIVGFNKGTGLTIL